MGTKLILLVSWTLLLQTGPQEPIATPQLESKASEPGWVPPKPSETPETPATSESPSPCPSPCPPTNDASAPEPTTACETLVLTPYNSKICPIVRELYCIALKKTDARRGPSFVTRLTAIDTLGKLKNHPESAVALTDLLQRVRLNQDNEDFLSKFERSLFSIHILQSLGNLGSEAECAIPEITKATSIHNDVVSAASLALEQILNSKAVQHKTIDDLSTQIEALKKELQKLTDEVHGAKPTNPSKSSTTTTNTTIKTTTTTKPEPASTNPQAPPPVASQPSVLAQPALYPLVPAPIAPPMSKE